MIAWEGAGHRASAAGSEPPRSGGCMAGARLAAVVCVHQCKAGSTSALYHTRSSHRPDPAHSLSTPPTSAPSHSRSPAPKCPAACAEGLQPVVACPQHKGQREGQLKTGLLSCSSLAPNSKPQAALQPTQPTQPTHTESPFMNSSGRSVRICSRAHRITRPTVHCDVHE